MNKIFVLLTFTILLFTTKAFAYTEISNPNVLQSRDTYQITVLNFKAEKFPFYTDYQATVVGPVPQMTIRISNFSPTQFEAGKTYLVERAEKNWLVVKEIK